MTSHKQCLPIRLVGLASLLVSITVVSTPARAQRWQVQVGAQSQDKGSQMLAFLPNELWIHAGDSVGFMIATDEPHTVTFLTPKQGRLPFAVGCPGTTPSGTIENGTACVNSGVMA